MVAPHHRRWSMQNNQRPSRISMSYRSAKSCPSETLLLCCADLQRGAAQVLQRHVCGGAAAAGARVLRRGADAAGAPGAAAGGAPGPHQHAAALQRCPRPPGAPFCTGASPVSTSIAPMHAHSRTAAHSDPTSKQLRFNVALVIQMRPSAPTVDCPLLDLDGTLYAIANIHEQHCRYPCKLNPRC